MEVIWDNIKSIYKRNKLVLYKIYPYFVTDNLSESIFYLKPKIIYNKNYIHINYQFDIKNL